MATDIGSLNTNDFDIDVPLDAASSFQTGSPSLQDDVDNVVQIALRNAPAGGTQVQLSPATQQQLRLNSTPNPGVQRVPAFLRGLPFFRGQGNANDTGLTNLGNGQWTDGAFVFRVQPGGNPANYGDRVYTGLTTDVNAVAFFEMIAIQGGYFSSDVPRNTQIGSTGITVGEVIEAIELYAYINANPNTNGPLVRNVYIPLVNELEFGLIQAMNAAVSTAPSSVPLGPSNPYYGPILPEVARFDPSTAPPQTDSTPANQLPPSRAVVIDNALQSIPPAQRGWVRQAVTEFTQGIPDNELGAAISVLANDTDLNTALFNRAAYLQAQRFAEDGMQIGGVSPVPLLPGVDPVSGETYDTLVAREAFRYNAQQDQRRNAGDPNAKVAFVVGIQTDFGVVPALFNGPAGDLWKLLLSPAFDEGGTGLTSSKIMDIQGVRSSNINERANLDDANREAARNDLTQPALPPASPPNQPLLPPAPEFVPEEIPDPWEGDPVEPAPSTEPADPGQPALPPASPPDQPLLAPAAEPEVTTPPDGADAPDGVVPSPDSGGDGDGPPDLPPTGGNGNDDDNSAENNDDDGSVNRSGNDNPRSLEPFTTMTAASWAASLGVNTAGQAVQGIYFAMSREQRLAGTPLDTSDVEGELNQFIYDPTAYMTRNYSGGPLGLAVDGAVYRETTPTKDEIFFQRLPEDLYQAVSDKLGNPETIRVPQYVNINGEGFEWVTVEMRRPARNEPWLGGEGIELIRRETRWAAPSGRIAITLGPPEGIRSRFSGEVTLGNPYFSGDATLLELVREEGGATLRQFNNVNWAVVESGLRLSRGNSDLEVVNDSDPTRRPQLSINGGTSLKLRTTNRTEVGTGDPRFRTNTQVIGTSATSFVISDPEGQVVGDLANGLYETIPGLDPLASTENSRQRFFINIGGDVWVNLVDGRFGKLSLKDAEGAPRTGLFDLQTLGDRTGEFNIQIGIQSDDVANGPDLLQEFVENIVGQDQSSARTVSATDELTSFVRTGSNAEITPFQDDIGAVMTGWAFAYDRSPEELSGALLPLDNDGFVVPWRSDQGQDFIQGEWVEVFGANFAYLEDTLPRSILIPRAPGSGDLLPAGSTQGLMLRFVAEEAGLAVDVPLTDDQRNLVESAVEGGARLPDLPSPNSTNGSQQSIFGTIPGLQIEAGDLIAFADPDDDADQIAPVFASSNWSDFVTPLSELDDAARQELQDVLQTVTIPSANVRIAGAIDNGDGFAPTIALTREGAAEGAPDLFVSSVNQTIFFRDGAETVAALSTNQVDGSVRITDLENGGATYLLTDAPEALLARLDLSQDDVNLAVASAKTIWADTQPNTTPDPTPAAPPNSSDLSDVGGQTSPGPTDTVFNVDDTLPPSTNNQPANQDAIFDGVDTSRSADVDALNTRLGTNFSEDLTNYDAVNDALGTEFTAADIPHYLVGAQAVTQDRLDRAISDQPGLWKPEDVVLVLDNPDGSQSLVIKDDAPFGADGLPIALDTPLRLVSTVARDGTLLKYNLNDQLAFSLSPDGRLSSFNAAGQVVARQVSTPDGWVPDPTFKPNASDGASAPSANTGTTDTIEIPKVAFSDTAFSAGLNALASGLAGLPGSTGQAGRTLSAVLDGVELLDSVGAAIAGESGAFFDGATAVTNLLSTGVLGDDLARIGSVGSDALRIVDSLGQVDDIVAQIDLAAAQGTLSPDNLAQLNAQSAQAGLGAAAAGLNLLATITESEFLAQGAAGVRVVQAFQGLQSAQAGLRAARASGDATQVATASKALGGSVANLFSAGFAFLGAVAGDNRTLQTIAAWGGVAASAASLAFATTAAATAVTGIGLVFAIGAALTLGRKPSSVTLAEDIDVTGDGSAQEDVKYRVKGWDYWYDVPLTDGALNASELSFSFTRAQTRRDWDEDDGFGAPGRFLTSRGLDPISSSEAALIQASQGPGYIDWSDGNRNGKGSTVPNDQGVGGRIISEMSVYRDTGFGIARLDDGRQVMVRRMEGSAPALEDHIRTAIQASVSPGYRRRNDDGPDPRSIGTRYFLEIDATFAPIFEGITGTGDLVRRTTIDRDDGVTSIEQVGVELTADQFRTLIQKYGAGGSFTGPQAQEIFRDLVASAPPAFERTEVTFKQEAARYGLVSMVDLGQPQLSRVSQYIDLSGELDGPSYRDNSPFEVHLRDANGQEYRTIGGETLSDIKQALDFEAPTLAWIASHPHLRASYRNNLDGRLVEATNAFIAQDTPAITFDGVSYLLANPDVAQAYGTDLTAAARHYIFYGADEGRVSDIPTAETLAQFDRLQTEPSAVLDELIALQPAFASVRTQVGAIAETTEGAAAIFSAVIEQAPEYAPYALGILAGASKDIHIGQAAPVANIIGASTTAGVLNNHDHLISNNGLYGATVNANGTLFIYDRSNGGVIWQTDNKDAPGGRVYIQGDGNIVVRSKNGTARWDSDTDGGPDVRRPFILELGDDGVLRTTDTWTGAQIWNNQVGKVSTPLPDVTTGILQTGDTLTTGRMSYNQSLVSENGQYHAIFHDDGRFVVYDISGTSQRVVWEAERSGNTNHGWIEMASNGAFKIADDDGDVEFDTSTGGNGADRAFSLVMQNDGNLVVYDSQGGEALWSIQTGKIKTAEANGDYAGDWSDVRALEYIASYGDLMNAFGMNSQAGRDHYNNHGHGEARETTFNVQNYIAANPDVAQAFGGDPIASIQHYMRHGRFEGRALAPGQAPQAPVQLHERPTSTWVDSEALEYIASHADLMNAFGANPNAGRQHFDEYGRGEGRKVTFDVGSYMAANPDVAQAHAGDPAGAVRHYITYGRYEGRSLAPGQPAQPAQAYPAPAGITFQGTTLTTGRMSYNHGLLSSSGRFAAVFFESGHFQVLDLAEGARVIWDARRSGNTNHGWVELASNGDLRVADDDGDVEFSSQTGGGRVDRAFSLVMQNDGNLVVYDSQGNEALWSSKGGRIRHADPN